MDMGFYDVTDGKDWIMTTTDTLAADINRLAGICHEEMSGNGRWRPSPSRPMKELGANSVLETFAFLHRSLGDAMTGHCRQLPDRHLKNRRMVEGELADVMIRLGDLAGQLGIDLGGAVVEKLELNRGRSSVAAKDSR